MFHNLDVMWISQQTLVAAVQLVVVKLKAYAIKTQIEHSTGFFLYATIQIDETYLIYEWK